MSGFIIYPEDFKRKVVRDVEMGLISKEEARRKYDIKGHSTVLKWIRKFAEENSFYQKMKQSKEKTKEELIKRIAELERQLEDEKLKSLGYSKIIDIAESQYNIPIRKKYDTKQSKR